jgi:hypothetical protein
MITVESGDSSNGDGTRARVQLVELSESGVEGAGEGDGDGDREGDGVAAAFGERLSPLAATGTLAAGL